MQSNGISSEIIWDPLQIFECQDNYKYAMVVLNQPIHFKQDHVLPRWEKANITITVDGGTNRWIEYLRDLAVDIFTEYSGKYLPNLVSGDMDSISPDILEKLQQTQVNITCTPDVMETDYTKALMKLDEYTKNNNIKLDGIHVFAETAGRLDQIISNINTLYICDKIMNTPVIQFSSDSLTWLLKAGKHKILIPEVLSKSKSWCALIPFGNSNSCVTTTGLKWNLNNTCMKFGGLISTSNTYGDEPEVSIVTNAPIIWTMGIEPLTNLSRS